ncbi:YggS family pyridoxal phosphate-dependent enzyme [Paenibacillus tarimensis]|uniref:YggS family pyridoxal phosphate-dependent enzyme n=1 Tax=Paenibacillus tarimensis TaxID=416012 RepID=UPI001F17B07E|nr:YggS family pyridoxal phosphate-dependent enzyme [Paenibacillus tarimensis]MCF2942127.1 YggS family pyridoxal phosphate-dependent enzyme [Paenibacillus tarimensis]
MSAADRLREVDRRITEACERSGRERSEVGVIAVTKYVSAPAVFEVLRTGLKHLGENRWQNAESKWRAVEEASGSDPDIGQAVWHFIGSLQTNKVKEVVGRFTYIHSLDRLSLAKAIDKQAGQLGIRVPCFVQVNVSGEDSKHGLAPGGLEDFVRQIADFQHLEVAGLMTMAPYEAEPEATRPVFRGLRELRDKLNASGLLSYEVKHLSMGMSNDFDIAVEEGATWLRLGSILVGKEEGVQ